MALTYEYKITGLKVKDAVVGNTTVQNLVCQTYWQLTGTDAKGNSGTFSGATPFTIDPTDNSGPHIPFDQLKEEDIITWVKSVVETNPGYKQHIDEKIQEQIDGKINPITEPSLPWASAATVDPLSTNTKV